MITITEKELTNGVVELEYPAIVLINFTDKKMLTLHFTEGLNEQLGFVNRVYEVDTSPCGIMEVLDINYCDPTTGHLDEDDIKDIVALEVNEVWDRGLGAPVKRIS